MSKFERWKISVSFVTEQLTEAKAAANELSGTDREVANRLVAGLRAALSVLMAMDV